MKTIEKKKVSRVLQILLSGVKIVFSIIVFLVKASFKFLFFVLAMWDLHRYLTVVFSNDTGNTNDKKDGYEKQNYSF